ncbi:MAG: outer membrane protein assembly factor BamA [Planctomycetes bacterium]|nr:outer membrane protein assembly factor BamA [Planctomycetota bacterium]MBI3833248.1 outer membrane protein assembly factor BamA [Planctomycetota bacterium]
MNKGRMGSVGGLSAIAMALCAAPALAQEPAAPQNQTIREIRVIGLKIVTQAYVEDVSGVKVGAAADRTALDEAVARLLRTGKFLSATYHTERAADGVFIIFDLKERPVVKKITFEGNSHFRDGPLIKDINQKLDQPADWFAIRDGRETIIAKYKEAGYVNADVTFDQQRLEDTGELHFKVIENQKVRVRKILIEGNRTLTDAELRRELETKTYIWIFRSGAYDKDKADGDVGRLQNHAHDEGFLDAKASIRTESMADSGDLTVIFTIDEGTQYKIEDITLKGNSTLGSDELTPLATSRSDEFVKLPRLDADARAIQQHYGELGYIDASCKPQRVFSNQPGFVKVTFEINEGEQFHVGRVTVRGNSRTKDKVVRRQLDLYPPDDLFNLTETKAAEKRLTDSRIFSSAKVIPTGDQPGFRDAVIDVKEAEKAGDFIFGAGITSNSGLVGSIVLDMQNFDIFDRPRSWSEFFSLRSFYGGGQHLRIELQPGTTVSRFRIDFTEPYLFDRPLRFDAGIYLFQRKRDGYTEKRFGDSLSLGKKFEHGLFQGWTGEIAFRDELVEVDDLEFLAAKDIREAEGQNSLFGLKGSLVRDHTDNRFVPTKGDRLRISYEQLESDGFFGKANVTYNWFTPTYTDRQDRKHVLNLHGETGAIVGSAPVYERYYAGGIGSIRGFGFRGVGPRDGIQDNNIGGSTLLLLGAEYSYPLYGQNLRGHFFLDSGTVGGGAYRAAIGAGVRFTLDLFGPFPIELNVGIPVMSDEDDKKQVFSFMVGSIF